jgi:hypothetical protein
MVFFQIKIELVNWGQVPINLPRVLWARRFGEHRQLMAMWVNPAGEVFQQLCFRRLIYSQKPHWTSAYSYIFSSILHLHQGSPSQ